MRNIARENKFHGKVMRIMRKFRWSFSFSALLLEK